jgi:hypothetical protein
VDRETRRNLLRLGIAVMLILLAAMFLVYRVR